MSKNTEKLNDTWLIEEPSSSDDCRHKKYNVDRARWRCLKNGGALCTKENCPLRVGAK